MLTMNHLNGNFGHINNIGNMTPLMEKNLINQTLSLSNNFNNAPQSINVSNNSMENSASNQVEALH